MKEGFVLKKLGLLIFIFISILVSCSNNEEPNKLVENVDEVRTLFTNEKLIMNETQMNLNISLSVDEKAYLIDEDEIDIYVFRTIEDRIKGKEKIQQMIGTVNLDSTPHFYEAENVLLIYQSTTNNKQIIEKINFVMNYITSIYEVKHEDEKGSIIPGIILFLSLISSGIYIKWRDLKYWKTVYESSTMSSEAYKRFSHLKSNGISCRLKTITPKGNRGAGGSPVMSSTSRVEVHVKDLTKALSLLEELNNRDINI